VNLLKRELSSLLAMQHDRIPRVYDWSIEGDYAFVVMEFFPSGSLKDKMPFPGAVEEAAVWRLLADLLTALSAAHKASILHLDIKPGNVLLDGNGGYVLTDFGVSQASRMNRGMIPMGVGTPGYQAPEQREGEFAKYDLRTDLWGVGATAYSMATGIDLAEQRHLLRDGSEGETFGLPPISDSRMFFSKELEDVVMSMLQIDPARRPGSVAEVLARVQAIVSGSGFDADTVAATRRSNVDDAEVEALIEDLVDPLMLSICRGRGFDRYFVKFEDGEPLCSEGEKSYYAFLLLRGTVRVSRAGEEIALLSREGTFLGEVATLTGLERTASMTAVGTVWACVLNAAELERFVTSNPAIGLRVIRDMARRLSRIPGDI
jgi:serine/threonine protein kinase